MSNSNDYLYEGFIDEVKGSLNKGGGGGNGGVTRLYFNMEELISNENDEECYYLYADKNYTTKITTAQLKEIVANGTFFVESEINLGDVILGQTLYPVGVDKMSDLERDSIMVRGMFPNLNNNRGFTMYKFVTAEYGQE